MSESGALLQWGDRANPLFSWEGVLLCYLTLWPLMYHLWSDEKCIINYRIFKYLETALGWYYRLLYLTVYWCKYIYIQEMRLQMSYQYFKFINLFIVKNVSKKDTSKVIGGRRLWGKAQNVLQGRKLVWSVNWHESRFLETNGLFSSSFKTFPAFFFLFHFLYEICPP